MTVVKLNGDTVRVCLKVKVLLASVVWVAVVKLQAPELQVVLVVWAPVISIVKPFSQVPEKDVVLVFVLLQTLASVRAGPVVSLVQLMVIVEIFPAGSVCLKI